MKLKKVCLLCRKPNNAKNYSCKCKAENWTREYRTLDVQLNMDAKERQKARKSVYRYRFDHPLGILQYAALPFRRFFPKGMRPVGMTNLYRLNYLDAKKKGNLFLKNEGDNPSGCFKDRETLMCLLNTRNRQWEKAVIYSSGNAAASAALFAQKLNLDLVTFVAGDTYEEKIEYIRNHGSDVIVIGDENTNFEEGFRLFAQLNASGLFVKHQYDNWSVRNPFRIQGDKTTALEIVRQMRGRRLRVPDYAVVPTANGSGLVGLWKGFKELKKLGLIDKLPKMVAAGIKKANPIAKAVRKKQINRPEKCTLDHLEKEDQVIGSTIIAEEGYDSVEAAKAVLESGGCSVNVENEEVKDTIIAFLEKEKELALKQDVLPEPASLVALTASRKLSERTICGDGDSIVSIVTGHGFKAGDALDTLLKDRPDLQAIAHQIIDKKKKETPVRANKKGRRINVPADQKALSEAFTNLKSAVV